MFAKACACVRYAHQRERLSDGFFTVTLGTPVPLANFPQFVVEKAGNGDSMLTSPFSPREEKKALSGAVGRFDGQ